MNKKLLIAIAAVPLLLVEAPVNSIGTGIFPNTSVLVGTQMYQVGALTRASATSCGGNPGVTVCHRSTPFLTRVEVTVGDLVLARNASTPIAVKGTNPGVIGIRGGFCADVTNGTLVAGLGTRTNAAGNEITHTSFAGRDWSFGYQASATTGLVEFFTVVNCVNGNGRADAADEWGFHSDKLLATQPTPVRLYVNADSVKASGPGCPDGHGNQSVLGAPSPPDIGNAGFKLEAFGLPPSSRFLFMVSIGGGFPGIDMTPMGAPGCVLRTALQVELPGLTTGGDPVRGEGSVVLPAPIPNDNALKGIVLSMQVGALDPNSKRSFPVAVTNGIEVTIR